MIIDTHTHLYLPDEFGDEASAAVERAIANEVEMMVFPNIDRASVEPMKNLHRKFPNNTCMAIGLHPTEVDDSHVDEQLQFVVDELNSPQEYVAIGEVGIDLYWDKTYRDRQMQVFERQLQMAAERKLPVIIHCREGLDEVLEVISGLADIPSAVFHSFGGTVEDIERIRRHGDFYFGINGIVTFKNSKLRDVLPAIGLDRILLETDSPYLTPVPFRGKRNESSYIRYTANCIAQIFMLSPDEIAHRTTSNATKFFNKI